MAFRNFWRWWFVAAILAALPAAACGGSDDGLVLKVGGIPDQDASRLTRRYEGFAAYLSDRLGVDVEYVPSADYAAVVTAFTQGGLDLAFFGGLTGVQARLRDDGAQAIVQRTQDARFHSKFIIVAGRPHNSLEDLRAEAGELTLTFGSESSTSGHLMPRHFLVQAGLDADTDFKTPPNFSGSHDVTWQLVEAGAFDVGALNGDVWERAVSEGRVDTTKVRVLETTPGYFDYNWTARSSLDQVYGDGFTQRVKDALLALDQETHGDILELFSTEGFIETRNENYQAIENTARRLGIIK